MTAVEMFYTVNEAALLLKLHRSTVLDKMKAREFGAGVVNLGSNEQPDYRVPASGLNDYLNKHLVFAEKTAPGLAARCDGELRRKAFGERNSAE